MYKLTRLQDFLIEDFDVLQDVLGIKHLSQLRTLTCKGLPLVKEVPDLSNFPHLQHLE